VSQLDPYLPLELRSKTWLENLAGFQGVRDVQTLPDVLVAGRKDLGSNLLSYIVTKQGRWDALLALVKSLLEIKPGKKHGIDFAKTLLGHSPWSESSLPPYALDDLTDNSLEIPNTGDVTPRRLRDLDSFIDSFMAKDETEKYRLAQMEIWDCLGDILIQSSKGEMGKEQDALPHVHRIIGHMHSVGAIPDAIYQYDSSEIPSGRRKPPFLHAMSSRIMAVISDSMWRSVEHDTIKNSALDALTYAQKGHELPGSRLHPRVRHLDVGVWLEFVLWSCFHAGYVGVGAALLSRVSKVRGDYKWSVVQWRELEAKTEQRSDAAREAEESTSWFLKLSGAIEGYSQEPSLVEMPKHSISREVVLALLDACVETDNAEALENVNAISKAYKELAQDIDGLTSDAVYNSMLVRLIDTVQNRGAFPEDLFNLTTRKDDSSNLVGVAKRASRTVNPKKTTRKATQLNAHDGDGQMLPPYLTSSVIAQTSSSSSRRVTSAAAEPEKSLNEDFAEELGNPWHGALLSAFVHAVDDNKFKEALSRFSQLQSLVDNERLLSIHSFSPNALADAEQANARLQQTDMQVPNTTTAAFLDMATNNKMLEFAKWMMESQDVDGTLIPSHAPKSAVYQPSLLRYAAATSNYPLIVGVTRQLSADLSEFSSEILRSLVECQIKLNKFDSAEEVLSYMCLERGIALDEDSIIGVICAYMELESQDPTSLHLYSLQQLLTRILSVEFVPPQNPARAFDYKPYRIINQFCRVCTTLPGSIAQIAEPLIQSAGPTTSKINLKTSAFNVLVRQVKDLYGVQEAYELVSEWCYDVSEDRTVQQPPREDLFIRFIPIDERIVKPNVDTIRILLEGIEMDQTPEAIEEVERDQGDDTCWSDNELRNESSTELSSESADRVTLDKSRLVEFAKTVYRRMGMDEAAIEAALPIAARSEPRQDID
jgi:hypothetical protein